MEHRDTIGATDLVVALRCILGIAPLDRPPTDDMPANIAPDLEVEGLNPRWLIAWVIAGMELFSAGKLPTLAATIIAARRTVAALALDAQLGSVTSAARLLATGPKNLRRVLEEAGAFPWRDPFDRHPPTVRMPGCVCEGEATDG